MNSNVVLVGLYRYLNIPVRILHILEGLNQPHRDLVLYGLCCLIVKGAAVPLADTR